MERRVEKIGTEEVKLLVIKAASGDMGAFGSIVRRFQNQAFARSTVRTREI